MHAFSRCIDGQWASGLLKFAMLKPGELIAYYFPLWKRGTKGDLQSLSRRQTLRIAVDSSFGNQDRLFSNGGMRSPKSPVKRLQIPLNPPFPKGEAVRDEFTRN